MVELEGLIIPLTFIPFAWIHGNGYDAAIPMREVSINDPDTTPVEKLATNIQIPIKTSQDLSKIKDPIL